MSEYGTVMGFVTASATAPRPEPSTMPRRGGDAGSLERRKSAASETSSKYSELIGNTLQGPGFMDQGLWPECSGRKKARRDAGLFCLP